jgi:hypothetical protein
MQGLPLKIRRWIQSGLERQKNAPEPRGRSGAKALTDWYKLRHPLREEKRVTACAIYIIRQVNFGIVQSTQIMDGRK